MAELVEGYQFGSQSARDRGRGQQPSAEIEEAGIPSDNPAVSGTCCDGCPMIHSSRRRNRRDQFRKRSGDQSVEDCYKDPSPWLAMFQLQRDTL